MQASELQNKFERIRANKWFEAFVISVIVISALLVGAKTYELPSAMASVTLFLDWFISAFFLTELTIRFLAEKRKRYFFKSFWNWFDTLSACLPCAAYDFNHSRATDFIGFTG